MRAADPVRANDIIKAGRQPEQIFYTAVNALDRRTSILHDEFTLLADARRLDPDALAQIHDAYYAPIFRYIAFRVTDREVAEDLTSEVFARLLAALRDRKSPRDALRSWLYGVAAHVVSDHYRQQYRAPQVDLDDDIASSDHDPAEMIESKLRQEDLKSAMQELTDEQRHVLALRFGAEMPIRDVARTLGKTEGAVKQLQARAVAALARKLSPKVVD